ncbi:MAG: hypothetical protein LHW64_05270 [Candidatus Cloacimonetes bacterium]|jgi:hypothetical protein|nr:hypothetical protein [Candidatus Cloacimonadota bacterium]MCB5287194.1 hypothetical protein [Candidatus Cloacimonadota bacterium]MCK9185739.1 hypothetical protein [Candidatus Cloacimonadota bacterium]MCK9584295.1 hypothetical protein [Candidatus Cloacimonadota bacterium]MDY0229515.1 hypothetical protein [Candidatus Cloacimonadaceae bacterium]
MVLSYYLLKPFYALAWRVLNLFQKRQETLFYCHTPVDMENWLPVQKHLKPIRVVTDKADTYKALKQSGIKVGRLPAFPKAVIMCRVSSHKFPSQQVLKIGMTHGAYHFKRMTSAQNYRPFSLYLFTSQRDLENAQKIGVTMGKVGGFPKLDPYLPVKHTDAKDLANRKARILFTATYEQSGMSAIQHWLPQLPELTDKYEIYVSVHPWTCKTYIDALKAMPQVHYIQGSPLPYIQKADLCVVDTSSIIAECTALGKPLISWILPDSPRMVPEIKEILDKISIRIKEISELRPAIARIITEPDMFSPERVWANTIFFDALDGKAGKRSAQAIIKLLPDLKL